MRPQGKTLNSFAGGHGSITPQSITFFRVGFLGRTHELLFCVPGKGTGRTFARTLPGSFWIPRNHALALREDNMNPNVSDQQPKNDGKVKFKCSDVGLKHCDWRVTGISEQEIIPKSSSMVGKSMASKSATILAQGFAMP
jgi:hypothetical protein